MASFSKFNCFAADVGKGVHDLDGDTLKVALANDAPIATNTGLGDITQISGGNGYTSGGNAAANNAYSQTGGVGKLTADDVVFTATGEMGPFRYAVLYNDTASNDELIGWWDYGSEVTLQNGGTFTVDFDGDNGILTIT